MPSVNIYVSHVTKEIIKLNPHVNWSKIANDAFQRHIESFDFSNSGKFKINYVDNPYYIDGPFVSYVTRDNSCNECYWFPLGWSE